MASTTDQKPLDTCCRTCLSHCKPAVAIKELLKKTSQIKPILTYLHIKVMGDEFPNQICNDCVKQIEDFNKFKEECSKSLKYLTEKLKRSSNKRLLSVDTVKSEEDENLDNNDVPAPIQEIKQVKTETIEFQDELTNIKKELDQVKLEEDSDHCGNDDDPGSDFELPLEVKLSKPKSKRRKKGEPPKKKGGVCDICKKFITNLKRHNLYKHGDPSERPTFSCLECNLLFNHAKSLYIHKKRVHDKSLTKVTCEICGVSVYHLSIHMKNTHGNIKFDCTYCEKSFKGKHSLKAHIDFVHENPNQLPKVLCQICGAAFKRNSELNKHLQARHSDARNYKCSFCERTFKTSSQSKVHERTAHSTIRPFACSYCPNAFALKKTLVNHIRIHTGEKPFVCEICFKAFTQKTTMMTHIKLIHGKEKY